MTPESLVAVRCRISRGGFSSERVFRVTVANGEEYIGAAPVDYFFDESKGPLPPEQPRERGSSVPGFVAGRVIEREPNGICVVSVPSGEVLRVGVDEISEYPQGNRTHV